MDKKDHTRSMMPHKIKSLKALLLSLALGVLGIILLLAILDSRAIVRASQREKQLKSSPGRILDVTAAPVTDSVTITKTVQPPNPDTGSVVSICFTIRGLGPRKLDVALAQDVSGSMDQPVTAGAQQTRLEASRGAAIAFVDSLPDTDRTAVISYSTTASVAQPLTTDKSAVTNTIQGLTTLGGTNIGEGIRVSHKELITSPRFMTDTIKTIILLSDGIATHPVNTDTARIYAQNRAAAAANDDVKIYTIGFGDDADQILLQSIADTGGGRYFFAPDGELLATIYLSIALELRSLVVTDILAPGVDADCSQWPDDYCVQGPSGVTTLTLPISNSLLVTDPVVLCFTATVNLDPNTQGPINLPGSQVCYQDSDGQPACDPFENPPVVVGGRKISGRVFHDVNQNGIEDVGEAGAADVTVRRGAGLTASTNVSGDYVLRTSEEPAISVTLEVPPGYAPTTATAYQIPPITGTYLSRNFGLYGEVCAQGKVFDDQNLNGQDDQEDGVAGATVVAGGGPSLTTDSSGLFTVCAPVNAAPITIVETDPISYVSTGAIAGTDVIAVDLNTLRIDDPEAGRSYGGNKFGDALAPLLVVAKESSSQSVLTHDTLRYTLTYRNAGYAVASNVRLTDSLPPGLVFQPPASRPPDLQTPDNELVWELGALDLQTAGEPIVITVTAIPSAPGQVLNNCVELKSDETSASVCTPVYARRLTYLPLVILGIPPVNNGGFENGWTGWTHGGVLSQTITSANPHSGRFSALLGNPAYECRNGVPKGGAWVQQSFSVPQTPNPRLSFWYNIISQDKNPLLTDQFDRFNVTIDSRPVFTDTKRFGRYGCDPDGKKDLGWQNGVIDLSGYGGQQITVRFENWNSGDRWYNTWTFVDDVKFLP